MEAVHDETVTRYISRKVKRRYSNTRDMPNGNNRSGGGNMLPSPKRKCSPVTARGGKVIDL